MAVVPSSNAYIDHERPITPGEATQGDEVALSVVVPSYNESQTLPSVIADIDKTCASLEVSYEIVVCDDASSDRSLPILRYLETQYDHLRTLHNERNQGVAGSLRRLYRQARGQWVAFWPADGQIAASELIKMWRKRGFQVVIGWRLHRRDNFMRCLLSKIFNLVVRVLFGLKVHDIDSVTLYQKRVLDIDFRSGELGLPVEILYRAKKRNMSYTEVIIEHLPRMAGKAAGVNLRSAWGTWWDLLRVRIGQAWD